MTSLCHAYVSGTPTTSMTTWLRKLLSPLTSFILIILLFGADCVFSLISFEQNIYVLLLLGSLTKLIVMI